MHTHGVDEWAAAGVPVGLVAKCILILVVALTALGTMFGLVHMWPSGKIPAVGALQTAAPGVSFPGDKLLKITPFSCPESGGGAFGGEQLQPNGSGGGQRGHRGGDRPDTRQRRRTRARRPTNHRNRRVSDLR